MKITALRLKQFRSYEDFSIELSQGVNIVVGANASGKTNLLEAVQVACVGSSYRARDIDLIKFNKDVCKVEMMSKDHLRSVKIQINQDKTNKTINIDGTEYKRITQDKIIPITLFEPEHMRMIAGSPERRRDYLDSILELVEPGYKNTLRQYKRALAQRNRLLKQERSIIKDQLFVWDVKISEFGSLIMKARKNLVERINQEANQVYKGLSSHSHSVRLIYRSKTDSKDLASALLKNLNASFSEDHLKGFTSIGPHRDDIDFILRDHPAQNSASRGESRTIVLMCKIVELKIIEESFGQKPIVLLDDVFSELDSKRRMSLTKYLKDYQVIITTTDADSVLEHFLNDTNVIALNPG